MVEKKKKKKAAEEIHRQEVAAGRAGAGGIPRPKVEVRPGKKKEGETAAEFKERVEPIAPLTAKEIPTGKPKVTPTFDLTTAERAFELKQKGIAEQEKLTAEFAGPTPELPTVEELQAKAEEGKPQLRPELLAKFQARILDKSAPALTDAENQEIAEFRAAERERLGIKGGEIGGAVSGTLGAFQLSIDALRSIVTGGKPSSVSRTEGIINDMMKNIDSSIEQVATGTMTSNEVVDMLTGAADSINQLETFQKFFGKAHPAYWQDQGLSLETDILVVKDKLSQRLIDLAAANQQAQILKQRQALL